jgi:peroxiredoxin
MKKLLLLSVMFMSLSMSVMAQDLDSLYAKTLLKPGETAPAFTLNKINGGQLSLSDLRGKYVLLDFWASWCPDCRKDIPKIDSLIHTYGSDSLVFVGVSFDTDKTAWTDCVNGNSMYWYQVSELKKWKETQISKDYGISWIPATYLIDPDGKVVLGTVMVEKMEKALQTLDYSKVEKNTSEIRYDLVGSVTMPKYPGGVNRFLHFLMNNVKYPVLAEKLEVGCKTIMSFNVETDGSVTDIKLAKMEMYNTDNPKLKKLSVGEQESYLKQCAIQFENESKRVLSLMPKWKPGVDNGKPVKVRFSVPITYRM